MIKNKAIKDTLEITSFYKAHKYVFDYYLQISHPVLLIS